MFATIRPFDSVPNPVNRFSREILRESVLCSLHTLLRGSLYHNLGLEGGPNFRWQYTLLYRENISLTGAYILCAKYVYFLGSTRFHDISSFRFYTFRGKIGLQQRRCDCEQYAGDDIGNFPSLSLFRFPVCSTFQSDRFASLTQSLVRHNPLSFGLCPLCHGQACQE